MERAAQAAKSARQRFWWLVGVAASRDIAVMAGDFPAGTPFMGLSGGSVGRRVICVNLDGLNTWSNWLGEQTGEQAEVCKWTTAAWVLLHELGHCLLRHGGADTQEARAEQDADTFARRVLERLDPRMTPDEASLLLDQVAAELARRDTYQNRVANWAQPTKAQVDDLTSGSRTGVANGQGLRALRPAFEGV